MSQAKKKASRHTSETGHAIGAQPKQSAAPGRKSADVVTLTRARYEALIERIEDLEDARIIREAEANRDRRSYLPIELAERIFAGEHPLRIWREHRALTLAALADKAHVPISYISEIETRKKPGSVAALKALAAALGLTIDDLTLTLSP